MDAAPRAAARCPVRELGGTDGAPGAGGERTTGRVGVLPRLSGCAPAREGAPGNPGGIAGIHGGRNPSWASNLDAGAEPAWLAGVECAPRRRDSADPGVARAFA